MLNFYNDRKQIFECKIKLEGTDKTLKEAKVRLVFEDGNIQRFYKGTTDVLGNCVVELPPLKELKNTKGNCSLEVRIENIIFEPYRTNYIIEESKISIVEAKVNDKVKLFKPTANKEDIKMVKEMIKAFNKLDSENRKVLYEYIDFKYEPSRKTKAWAKKIFNDLDDVKSKIAMYEVENIFSKK